MDIFDSKSIKPMLLAEEAEPFDSEEYLFEIKLDGIRCIMYLDTDETEIRNKRNDRLNHTYPELKNLHKQVKKRCILDGELLVLKEGKPNFQEVQRRSLMTNSYKIELASKKSPVLFTAYDILYLENKQITDLNLIERKKLLTKTVRENESISIARYIEIHGIDLYNLTVQHDLEGIVAKLKNSKYYFDKRSKDWIKIKFLKDEDFVICGYITKSPMASIVLGIYKNGILINQGHVTIGVSRDDFQKIMSCKRVSQSFYSDFPVDVNTVWIEPTLVCSVKFMMRTSKGGLRQPVFKELRNDKKPEECKL
ncbi:MAG: dependent ligase [Bacillales bacterium]|jgi:DNA ligase D-like protein (predicted ligase)|nr:dependent ligase [Bacillales bacterium]